VNFFHVSVPDIEVYSDLPDDSTYDQQGTTIIDNRCIRHEYITEDEASLNFDGIWTGTAINTTVYDYWGDLCGQAS
jgi:hypothetical protein